MAISVMYRSITFTSLRQRNLFVDTKLGGEVEEEEGEEELMVDVEGLTGYLLSTSISDRQRRPTSPLALAAEGPDSPALACAPTQSP